MRKGGPVQKLLLASILSVLALALAADAQTKPTLYLTGLPSDGSSPRVMENVGTYNVKVRLNPVSTKTVTVNCVISSEFGGGIKATPGVDYSVDSGKMTLTRKLVFAPNDREKNCSVPIIDDMLDERPESLLLNLDSGYRGNDDDGNPIYDQAIINELNGAEVGGIDPSDPSGMGLFDDSTFIRIIDNDPESTVQFGSATASVAEGDGAVAIEVTLNRAHGRTLPPSGSATAEDAKVNYTIASGSGNSGAVSGQDFDPGISASGSITIPAGATKATAMVNIGITDDDLNELDETFTITLSAMPQNLTLGTTATQTVTILDNDPPGISLSPSSVNENAGSATFTATLDGLSSRDVKIRVGTGDSGDTAVAGQDYATISDVDITLIL